MHGNIGADAGGVGHHVGHHHSHHPTHHPIHQSTHHPTHHLTHHRTHHPRHHHRRSWHHLPRDGHKAPDQGPYTSKLKHHKHHRHHHTLSNVGSVILPAIKDTNIPLAERMFSNALLPEEVAHEESETRQQLAWISCRAEMLPIHFCGWDDCHYRSDGEHLMYEYDTLAEDAVSHLPVCHRRCFVQELQRLHLTRPCLPNPLKLQTCHRICYAAEVWRMQYPHVSKKCDVVPMNQHWKEFLGLDRFDHWRENHFGHWYEDGTPSTRETLLATVKSPWFSFSSDEKKGKELWPKVPSNRVPTKPCALFFRQVSSMNTSRLSEMWRSREWSVEMIEVECYTD